MRNLLSVNICRFSLNIHFSWAFILAKLLCYNISDLKHRQKAGKTSQHSMESACWIHPGLLLCCCAQPLISLLVWRLKVAFSGNRREWEKNGCLCKSVAGSVIQDSKLCMASTRHTASCSLALTALEYSLEKSQAVGLFFYFFFFFKFPCSWALWSHSSKVCQSLKALTALFIYFYKFYNKSL